MKIGFIGIGAMGKPMAMNLLKVGHEVYAFDLSETALREVGEKGAKICTGIAELSGKADVILCSLPNAAIVAAAMTGPDGVFENARPGILVADMSSVSPGSTKRMFALAAKKGIDYIDAPVSGGVSGAEAGSLTIMVGATKEAFEKIKPIFDVLGKNIYHVGETGAGDAVKIVNNLLLGCNMAALAEALVLGVKCGLSPEVMKEILSVSSGKSYVLDAKLEKFILADHFQGGFATDLQYKDLHLALEVARDERMPLPMSASALQLFEAARAKGYGREDMSGVIRVWEELTGARVSGWKKEE